MTMKAALIYDEKSAGGVGPWVEAEYESAETIEALLSAIEAHCERAVPVAFGPSLVAELEREEPDLAFNIAEGLEGPCRESIVPAILEHMGIPYTGSDGVTLGVSLNKALTKHLAAGAGIRTPAFRLAGCAEEAERAAGDLEFPVLVKPNFGGSSVGIDPQSIVEHPADLVGVVADESARYNQPCLIEGFVRGVDVTVGLLGNGEVESFPPGYIIAAGGLYSARVKQMHDREIVCPCRLPAGLEEELVDWSRTIYGLIGCRDFARVDYMVDDRGRAYFLEVNPLPGLSPYYGIYPVLAEAAGYDHTALIGRIMELALARPRYTRSMTHEPMAR